MIIGLENLTCSFKMLFISILTLFIFINSAKTQATNEQVFHQLMKKWDETYTGSFNSVEGFTTPYLLTFLQTDSTAPRLLFIRDPEVVYTKTRKKEYLRTLSVTLIYRDSTDQEFELANKDTLSSGMIPFSRKTKHYPLKGNDPRWTKKFLLPVIGIASGITTIVTLFYLRSR